MGIRAENIGVNIDGRVIFSQIHLETLPGTMIALTGPSGSGKTTLLNCLGMIQKVSAGSISFDGDDATQWRDARRTRFWRDHAAFIYQDYGVIEDETVAYNVALTKFGLRSATSRVSEALDAVGLADRAGNRAVVLSGGEKQRLGVARAIYKNAKFIFADEPTASLDSRNRDLVTNLLRSRVDGGACVVIATHDTGFASECDSRIELASPK